MIEDVASFQFLLCLRKTHMAKKIANREDLELPVDLNLNSNSSTLSLADFVPVGYISIHPLLSILQRHSYNLNYSAGVWGAGNAIIQSHLKRPLFDCDLLNNYGTEMLNKEKRSLNPDNCLDERSYFVLVVNYLNW